MSLGIKVGESTTFHLHHHNHNSAFYRFITIKQPHNLPIQNHNKMRFTIAVSALIGLAAAAPAVTPTKCPVDQGWELSNIIKETSNIAKSLKFNLKDTSKGLEITTKCEAIVVNKTSTPTFEGSYSCGEQSIDFSFDEDTSTIHVHRGYTDPCVGTPDFVQAFGQKVVPFTTLTTSYGSESKASKLYIPVTAMTA
ncbi:Hypothetical protein R9X50_00700200 [Acrodontium crateriforme]|uniref:AA1-like domain-containing protein n=1 Tax=Acrodontium crateriforme TaxID=150365 RepID=A0AAQ3MAT9_9PEZI|nr:Hypothetical protein R9X50_00700200 [Acrodontium crateriforme]